MSLQQLGLLLICSAAVIEAKFYSAAIARERLVTDLFVNYDPSAKPTKKGERIDVNVNIGIQHFDFRESDGAFSIVGVLDATWHDPKLAWNPTDYNNLTKIPVNQKVVWVPDLEVYNTAPDKFLRMHRNGIVMLENTGQVLWSDTIAVVIFCTTDMHNWPHDRHTCKLSLGSWTYDGFELDITNANPNASLNFNDVDMMNMEYKVTNYTGEHVATLYSCCAEPYITIDYHITFERRSSFVIIFRAPAFCVVLLTLLALILEPWRAEKIWLNGVSFLIIVFNLIYFAENIGRFSRGTPLIVIFYSFSLVLVTLVHLICVFSLLATRTRFRGRLPLLCSNFLKSSFVHYIAPAEVINAKYDQHRDRESNAQFEDVKLQEFSNLIGAEWSSGNEWIQLAKVLERVTVVVAAFIYLILGTACFV